MRPVRSQPVLFVMFAALALMLAGLMPGLATSAGADEIMPGQDVRLPDNDLIEAVRDGDMNGVEAALRSGILPDDTGIGRVPATIVAVEHNQLAILKLLLERGANANRPASDGRTALSVAAQAGRQRMITVLLAHGADPNLIVDHGDTALFIAVRAHRTTIVQMLIEHGADVGDTDVTGRSALDLAEERHFDDIAQLLRSAGA